MTGDCLSGEGMNWRYVAAVVLPRLPSLSPSTFPSLYAVAFIARQHRNQSLIRTPRLPFRQMQTLLSSDQSSDWVKLSSMFLGPPAEGWKFEPKHKSNANDATASGGGEVQG